MTPGATSVVDDVDPDVDPVDDVAVAPLLNESDAVDFCAAGFDDPSGVSLAVASVVLVVSALSPVADDASDVSAQATAGDVITAMPIPSAAASAPTRPM